MNKHPAATSATLTKWMAGQASQWAAIDGVRWLFVARVLLAAFGALGLAFYFGLDSPSTAMTTTFILAMPSSGMVLEKAYYRLLGTVAGCTGALVLTALFVQSAPLLFAGLAVWVAACTCGAALRRNQQSYSFVLAGYTAAMIAVPALDAPDGAFMLAATRLTEVGLGILCAGLVHDVLFPRHLQAGLLRAASARRERFAAFCRDVLSHQLDAEAAELAHLRFAADVAALETGRAAASFEASHAREHTRQLNAYNSAFMAALGTLYTLHRLLLRLRGQSDSALPGLLEERLAALAAMVDGRAVGPVADSATGSASGMTAATGAAAPAGSDAAPAALLAQTHATDGVTGLTHAQQIDFDTACELLDRFSAEYAAFTGLHDDLVHGRSSAIDEAWAYAPATPLPIVLASGARAACALLLAAGCWYWLAWPYFGNALVMCCIFCALASSSPRPTAMLKQIMSGFVLASVLSFVTEFWLVMQADGFATLALAGAPLFGLGAWLTSDPKRAGMGIGISLFSAQVFAPANLMQYDMELFANTTVSMLGGVLLAWAVFAVLLPEHTVGRAAHVARALWRETRAACRRPLRAITDTAPLRSEHNRLRHHFDSRVRDLLNQLAAASGPEPGPPARAVVRQALMLLELGHAAIGLRVLAAEAQADKRQATQAAISAALATGVASAAAQADKPVATQTAAPAAPAAGAAPATAQAGKSPAVEAAASAAPATEAQQADKPPAALAATSAAPAIADQAAGSPSAPVAEAGPPTVAASATTAPALLACVKALAAYCHRPGARRHAAVLEAVLTAGAAVRAALPGASAQRTIRLRAALADLHALHTSLLDQPLEKDVNHAP